MITSLITIFLAPIILRLKVFKMLDLIARILLGMLFILTGIGKVMALQQTRDYMVSFGLPEWLLYPTICLEVVGGVLLIVGWQTRATALGLALFTIAATLIFHSDFGVQTQIIMTLKNLAIVGGLLMLVQHGSMNMSVDCWRQKPAG